MVPGLLLPPVPKLLRTEEFFTVTTADLVKDGRVVQNLNEEVRQFIVKKFPLARKQQIGNADRLLESGLLDSQGVLEVVAFIEQNFPIIVSDDDLLPENFHTIDRIVAFIRSKTIQSKTTPH
jgi:acyl carrier protein